MTWRNFFYISIPYWFAYGWLVSRDGDGGYHADTWFDLSIFLRTCSRFVFSVQRSESFMCGSDSDDVLFFFMRRTNKKESKKKESRKHRKIQEKRIIAIRFGYVFWSAPLTFCDGLGISRIYLFDKYFGYRPVPFAFHCIHPMFAIHRQKKDTRTPKKKINQTKTLYFFFGFFLLHARYLRNKGKSSSVLSQFVNFFVLVCFVWVFYSAFQ